MSHLIWIYAVFKLQLLSLLALRVLTLKAPITTAADDIHKYFSLFFTENKTYVSSESSAEQRIHMKNQALFYSKGKIKMLSAATFVWRFKG